MKQNILPSQGGAEYLESLGIAIEREIKAHQMYMSMAKYAGNDHFKNKLLFLAGEEKNHRENLEDLYKKISGKTKDFDSLVTPPPEDEIRKKADVEIIDLICFAIGKENEANKLYHKLADKSPDEGTKDLFRYLAEEEITHRRILEVELNLYKRKNVVVDLAPVEMMPGGYREWW